MRGRRVPYTGACSEPLAAVRSEGAGSRRRPPPSLRTVERPVRGFLGLGDDRGHGDQLVGLPIMNAAFDRNAGLLKGLYGDRLRPFAVAGGDGDVQSRIAWAGKEPERTQ